MAIAQNLTRGCLGCFRSYDWLAPILRPKNRYNAVFLVNRTLSPFHYLQNAQALLHVLFLKVFPRSSTLASKIDDFQLRRCSVSVTAIVPYSPALQQKTRRCRAIPEYPLRGQGVFVAYGSDPSCRRGVKHFLRLVFTSRREEFCQYAAIYVPDTSVPTTYTCSNPPLPAGTTLTN